ncbi:uncharacterized protein LOC128953692 isoform X1 [Oppia nitens]|uniref:uncharacterized protein LOC128953692 isoform X1 n=1 Tax=Oppia nitens TaxID=1686743 RepID=UPI0023DA2109|nr:uncharacterized protein LOC128953692 isoform X1 [Oppia nitens]
MFDSLSQHKRSIVITATIITGITVVYVIKKWLSVVSYKSRASTENNDKQTFSCDANNGKQDIISETNVDHYSTINDSVVDVIDNYNYNNNKFTECDNSGDQSQECNDNINSNGQLSDDDSSSDTTVSTVVIDDHHKNQDSDIFINDNNVILGSNESIHKISVNECKVQSKYIQQEMNGEVVEKSKENDKQKQENQLNDKMFDKLYKHSLNDYIYRPTTVEKLDSQINNNNININGYAFNGFHSSSSSSSSKGSEELPLNNNTESNEITNANNLFDCVPHLAAIVLTDDHIKDWCEIVCITTGSDTIETEYLEPEYVVVDCRAPVLARRGLIRYLYNKLTELVTNQISEDESIFRSITASNRFQLKNNFKFSLYLNEPIDSCLHMRGTAANDSEVSNGQSVRLKSTTDKLSVWSQVGVQGSLLSHFVDAIYITSVITGVPLNERSFHQHFVQNYTREPKLMKCEKQLFTNMVKQLMAFQVKNAFPFPVAINWINTEEDLESIDCRTGKAIDTGVKSGHLLNISRLSKHSLYHLFCNFLANYEHSLRPHQSMPQTYRKWKETAPNYRIQKQLLKVRYAVAGRQWTTMPSDLDLFN